MFEQWKRQREKKEEEEEEKTRRNKEGEGNKRHFDENWKKMNFIHIQFSHRAHTRQSQSIEWQLVIFAFRSSSIAIAPLRQRQLN